MDLKHVVTITWPLLASEGPDLSVLIPFPNSRIVLVRLNLVAPDEFRRGELLAAPKTKNHTTSCFALFKEITVFTLV